MAKLRSINKKAADELLHYPQQHWCRAYQSTRCSTHMVDNNCSESFNSSISDARHKPIISMLEDIRLLAMQRIRDRKVALQSWKTDWAPNAMKMFEANKTDSVDCHVVWNGEYGYEVSDGEDRHIVFVDTKTCTCRAWELTGIAMPYAHSIQPLPGVKFWNVKEEDAIEPPPVEKKIGRPKKNRVRTPNEPKHRHKLSRVGKAQHCSLCGSETHKKNSCSLNPKKVDQNAEASTSSKPKRKAAAGLGLYVNLETGKQVLNPGGSQSVVINEGTQRESEPNVKFPIPNERELRREKKWKR
ncbi:uncharacterized protein LOC131026000 [Salvia miltiorrhiza]|uniref:uncharacterized protein LOC131026000 n=1 Tax=Salvia miltiorrhiza TaxID=226208 RepID=UPI0025AD024D|nr:uncharacterized protein LOC131026000 [Salvia miltiorrhiza]